MAMMVTTRLLRRGRDLVAGISALGFVGLLLYGNNLSLFLEAMLSLQWGWALLGVGLASLDWVGGGLRLWVITRHVYPKVTLQGSVVAGGLNTWGGFLTPTPTGGRPLDDLRPQALRRPAARGDDLEPDDLRGHGGVLRRCGAGGIVAGCRPLAGAARNPGSRLHV